MIEIVTRRRHETAVAFSRVFDWRHDPGAGFAFPCNEAGEIETPLAPAAAENLARCLSGEYNVIDRGIERRTWSYTIAAVGRCRCGRSLSLDAFTNSCDCGREYNFAGQELAPRSQWGEETGETAGDIDLEPYGVDL